MRRIDVRNAILCAAAVTAAFLIVNPFVQLGFDDDFSYSWTVRRLLDTGHITFNGWSAPILITHALWGALFAKIFGFSFIVLRFSTLPMAVGSAVITYFLARNAKISPSTSVFASLTLCLCPAFLPLADSFMTDVPGLFYMLASVYALTRAGQSARLWPSLAWLFAGVLAGMFGGMARQTVWGVPLCVIPYLIIVRRREWWFVVAAIAGWVVVALDAHFTLLWFSHQPWVFIDPTMGEYFRMAADQPVGMLISFMVISFTAVMFALPALVPFSVDSLVRLWRERRTWRAAVAAVVIGALSFAASRHPSFEMMPWLYNIVTIKGAIGPLELSGNRAFTMPIVARGAVSALVLVACYLMVARLAVLLLEPRKTLEALKRSLGTPDSRIVLAIYGIAYCGLVVVRTSHDLIFDRYCLPMVPCLAIPLLAGRRPGIAWGVLGVYILYALASTQDNLALAHARRAAIDRLEAAGVPRTAIAAGLEYDFYTQLQERGHINRAGVTNPLEPFNDFAGYTPAIRARYRLEYPRYEYMRPTSFGEIDYISWLPPFRRKVMIDEFPDPWWLGTTRPGSTPVPSNFEVDYED